MQMQIKQCSTCSRVLSVDCFSKNNGGLLGVRKQCKECYNTQNRTRYKANKNKVLEKQAIYRSTHQKEIIKKNHELYQNNKEHYKQLHLDYRKNNKEKIKQYNREYMNHRRHTNIQARLAHNLRARLWYYLKNHNIIKQSSAIKDLGCSVAELVLHLKAQFKPGMSFDNGTVWNIDHIKPLCKFDLTKPKEQQEASHLTNLQPLFVEDNLKKGGSY